MKGRLKPNPNAVFTPHGGAEGKFMKEDSSGKYDSILSNFMVDRNVWRLIAIIAVSALVACLGLLGYMMTLPETELVVIGVNDIGETKYYGSTRGISYDGYDNKDDIISNILTDFLKKTYTVTTDGELMYNNYAQAMCYLESGKRRSYEADIRDRDPFKDVGRIKNVVTVETVIPVSKSSYQVDWTEVTTELHGFQSEVVKKRGIFTFRRLTAKQYNALDEKTRMNNPMGIYITDYNIVVKDKE